MSTDDRRRSPIACTLDAGTAISQLGEWAAVRGDLLASQPIPDGVILTFPIRVADVVEDLARREAVCCGFLTITTDLTGDMISVSISSPDRAAAPVIALLAGEL